MRLEDRSGARGSSAGLLAALAVVVGVGCSGSPLISRADGAAGAGGPGTGAAGTGGAGDGYGGASGCALLGDDGCAADPNCRPNEVQAIFEEESCVLPPYPVGCAPRTCNGPTVRAVDVYQRPFLVPGGCLPYEWIPAAGSTTLAACAPCEPLSVAECKATPYCQVVKAQPIDDLRSCLLSAQEVACAPGALRCASVGTRATDPAGKVWSVPGPCVPPGWSADAGVGDFPACAYPTGPEVCASLSARDCPLDTSCRVLTGKEIDIQKSCATNPQPAGCIRADATCDDSITRARDTNQNTWIFSDTCLPTDWLALPASSAPVPDCPP